MQSSLQDVVTSISQELQSNDGSNVGQNHGHITNHYHSVHRFPGVELETAPPSSRYFIGREAELQKIWAAFSNCPKKTARRVFVIAGLPGIGKSELCFKYAEDHEDHYDMVYSVDTTSAHIADQYLQKLRRVSRETQRQNLLILDNADDPRIDYSQWLPHRANIDVLMTTRDPELIHEYHSLGYEILEILTPSEAEILLRSCIGLIDFKYPDKQQLSLIGKELGFHPLAITHAGAYMRRTQRNVEYYLDLYRANSSVLLRYNKRQNTSRLGSVHNTFETSVAYMKHLHIEGSAPATFALELLNFLPFVVGIFSLQTLLHRVLRPVGSHIPNFLQVAASDYLVGATSRHDIVSLDALTLLESFSIIPAHSLHAYRHQSIHPLIRAWSWDRQTLSSKAWAWSSVVKNLSAQVDFAPAAACAMRVWRDWPLSNALTRLQWATPLCDLANLLLDIYFMQDDVRAEIAELRHDSSNNEQASYTDLLRLYQITTMAFPSSESRCSQELFWADRMLALINGYNGTSASAIRRLAAARLVSTRHYRRGIETIQEAIDGEEQINRDPFIRLVDAVIVATGYARENDKALQSKGLKQVNAMKDAILGDPAQQSRDWEANPMCRLLTLVAFIAEKSGERQLAVASAREAAARASSTSNARFEDLDSVSVASEATPGKKTLHTTANWESHEEMMEGLHDAQRRVALPNNFYEQRLIRDTKAAIGSSSVARSHPIFSDQSVCSTPYTVCRSEAPLKFFAGRALDDAEPDDKEEHASEDDWLSFDASEILRDLNLG